MRILHLSSIIEILKILGNILEQELKFQRYEITKETPLVWTNFFLCTQIPNKLSNKLKRHYYSSECFDPWPLQSCAAYPPRNAPVFCLWQSIRNVRLFDFLVIMITCIRKVRLVAFWRYFKIFVKVKISKKKIEFFFPKKKFENFFRKKIWKFFWKIFRTNFWKTSENRWNRAIFWKIGTLCLNDVIVFLRVTETLQKFF